MKRLFVIFFLTFFVSVSFAKDLPVFFGEEVVVTAAKFAVKKASSFSQVRIIKSSDIEKAGALTVSDALRLSPDVLVKSTGGLGGISTIKLKSAASEQVLVLLDGTRLNSSLLGLVDLNDISCMDIERIEIISEPVSILYGSEAMGGVINIITRKGHDPLTFSMKAGSYGLFDAGLGVKKDFGPLSLSINYGQTGYGGYRVNGDYRSKSASIMLNAAGVMEVKHTSSASNRGNPGVPNSDTDPSSASLPNDRQTDSYSNTSATFSFINKDNIKARLGIYNNFSDERVHYADWFVPGIYYDDQYVSGVTAAELVANVKALPNMNIDSGIEVKKNYGNSAKAGTHTVENNAFFVNADILQELPVSISTGVRYDNNSTFGGVLNPRLAFMCKSNGFLVRTSLSSAFRAPTINELYWNDPSWGTYGNPNLRPERSMGANLSIEKDLGMANITLSYYQNRFTDMIRWSQTSPFSWQPVNISKAKIDGLSFEIKKEIFGGAVISVGYETENALDTVTIKRLTYSPLSRGTLSFSAGSDANIALDINARSVSEVFTDSSNTKKLPGHTEVDLGLEKTVKGIQYNIIVKNVFDTRYSESVGTSPVDWKERGYPMPGRTIEFGVKI